MKPLLPSAALATLALPALAQDDELRQAVRARRAMFTLYGTYIGPLAGMARGEIDYDADVSRRSR